MWHGLTHLLKHVRTVSKDFGGSICYPKYKKKKEMAFTICARMSVNTERMVSIVLQNTT